MVPLLPSLIRRMRMMSHSVCHNESLTFKLNLFSVSAVIPNSKAAMKIMKTHILWLIERIRNSWRSDKKTVWFLWMRLGLCWDAKLMMPSCLSAPTQTVVRLSRPELNSFPTCIYTLARSRTSVDIPDVVRLSVSAPILKFTWGYIEIWSRSFARLAVAKRFEPKEICRSMSDAITPTGKYPLGLTNFLFMIRPYAC